MFFSVLEILGDEGVDDLFSDIKATVNFLESAISLFSDLIPVEFKPMKEFAEVKVMMKDLLFEIPTIGPSQ